MTTYILDMETIQEFPSLYAARKKATELRKQGHTHVEVVTAWPFEVGAPEFRKSIIITKSRDTLILGKDGTFAHRKKKVD